MSHHKPWSYRWLVRLALTAVSLPFVACSGSDAPQGSPLESSNAPAREATSCGVIELTAPDGSVVLQPEYYFFDAIDEKLALNDELREHVGLPSVGDCASARTFMRRYREYLVAHPDHPTNDPDPDLDDVAVRPGSEDAPDETTEKIQAGPLSANPAAVLLQFTGIPVPTSCSGIAIGTYGLLTAAHCIGPMDGWQQIPVAHTSSSGTLQFIRNEFIWVFWTRHPSWGGPGDPVDDVAVGTIWNAYPANTLPSPTTFATRIWLGSLGTGGTATLVGYGASDIFGNGLGFQRTGAETISAVGTGYIDALVPPGAVTVGCHGDSGGPLFGFSAGFQVALGLYTEFDPDTVFACPITSATQTFARLRTKISWIESRLGFACSRFSGGTSGTYARCW